MASATGKESRIEVDSAYLPLPEDSPKSKISPLIPNSPTMSGCLGLRFLADIFTFATVYALVQAKDLASGNKIYTGEDLSDSPAFELLHSATMLACLLSNVPAIYALILDSSGIKLGPKRYVLVFVTDTVNLVLLLAASACATTAHYVSYYGDSVMGWEPICDSDGELCYYHGLALIFSYLNSAFYLVVVIYSHEVMRQQFPDN